MANYRSIKRNELITLIKTLKKAIKNKCYQCIGDEKRIGCFTEGCGVFPHRPWINKQVNKNQSEKVTEKKTE